MNIERNQLIKTKIMATLKFNEQTITDTFQFEICENYDEALDFGVFNYGWDEDETQIGKEKVSFKLEDGKIIDTILNCIYIDSGSVDYIYYL